MTLPVEPDRLMQVEFNVGPWLVQPTLNCVSRAGVSRRLEPKAIEVLVQLAGCAGSVVPKSHLMRSVWRDTFVGDEVLTRCIWELRKAFEDDPKDPQYIQTIPKRGYRLVAEVRLPEPETVPGPAVPAVAPPKRRWKRVAIGAAAALAVLAAGYFVGRRWLMQPAPARERLMLAVLPFQNLGRDPREEYFADGLTEEMITQLARLQPTRLGVIARTSAMRYKQSGKGIGEIGRELRVDYIVEGSVRREGDRVRISVQLIQVSDQAHLWAENYDRELSGVLAVQTEVVRAVAARIRLAITGPADAGLPASKPVNGEAYVSYLMGNDFRHKLTPEDLEAGLQRFRRAVELDPGFARAWLGLADCYRLLGSWWGDWPPAKAFPLAEDALRQALKLDPTIGEAHGSLGWIRFVYHWDWAGAEAEFRRGVELAPNGRDALSPYANFLRRMKRLEEARREIDRCVELDPLSALEVTEAARVYLDLGEAARAYEMVRGVAETDPQSRATLLGLGQFYLSTGDVSQAMSFFERASRLTHRDRLALPTLGLAYARAGRIQDARTVLGTLLATPEVAQGAIAELYAALGEKEEGIRWWQRAFEKRDSRMVWLRLYSTDHPLWHDPRFQDLIRRMNFPE